jgi:hypothetical protein
MPRCPATKTVLPFSSNGVLAIGNLPPGYLKIARHHFPDELRNAPFRILNSHVHSNKAPGLPQQQFNATNQDTLRWTGP